MALLAHRLTQQQHCGGGKEEVLPMDFGRYMFAYEEGERPAEFFLPFAWQITVRGSMADLGWRSEEITLVDVD